MAAAAKIPVTITYRKPGTQPPLFVAGSFSEPAWNPQEMHATQDEDGQFTFTATFEAPPLSNIQYKFRVGLGDWWVLNEDAPTATDAAGNRNNTLTVPAPALESQSEPTNDSKYREVSAQQISETSSLGKPDIGDEKPFPTILEPANPDAMLETRSVAQLKGAELRRLSTTPIEQVAATAAEVADTAEKLDADNEMLAPKDKLQLPSYANYFATSPIQENAQDGTDSPATEAAPLFAHEALGAYEFPDDDEDEDAVPDDMEPVDRVRSRSPNYDLDEYDLNDPTLERFPSDRDSIMDTVRRVETGLNEDQTAIGGVPPSPVMGTRKESHDQHEDLLLSPGASSPVVSSKLDIPRRPHGSMTSERSLLSLGSIAEEEPREPLEEETWEEERGEQDEVRQSAVVTVPSPAVRSIADRASPTSDDDEGVDMQGSKGKQAMTTAAGDIATPQTMSGTPARDDWDNGPANSSKTTESKPDSLSHHPTAETNANRPKSPSIVIQPPEVSNGSEGAEHGSAKSLESQLLTKNGTNGATVTSGREQGVNSQLRKRNTPSDRPVTPTSIHEHSKVKGNWLQAFFRVLFVDWIGGFINRLFGSKGKAMLTTGTTGVFAGVAWWKYGKDWSGIVKSFRE